MAEAFATERAALVPLFLLSIAVLVGCTTPRPNVSTESREAPVRPRYNLSGYPESFKQGYGDACASPSRRNDQKYKADTDYQIGWNDGRAVCRK